MTSSDQPQAIAQSDPAASRAGGPRFALVIASSGARSWLTTCLSSLIPQCLRNRTELIVARVDSPSGMQQLSTAYPYARFISAPPHTEIPELRRAGLAASNADVVVLLDDTTDWIPDERWLEGVRWRRALDHHPAGEAQGKVLGTRGTGDVGSSHPGTVEFVPHISPPVINHTRYPYLSVVVPVHQGADVLRHALEALSSSDLPRTEWELIVADDASTDDTPWIAADYADIVVRLPGRPRGPAYARNRGFEFARGEYVAFIDADVCVHRDTLAQFVLVLSREPAVSAVFGSFDCIPATKGLVSQYRNLQAHYYHQEFPGPAETFWASCGAIRGVAFVEAGMFDEWRFPRHQVEDFELGYQLRERGRRIDLRPEIQATSLSRWTLGSMMAADLQDRSVPWMRIFGRRRAALRRRKTRLRMVKSVNTALTWAAVAAAFGALAGQPWLLLGTVACVVLVVTNDRAQHRFFAQERGSRFALAAVPLQLLSYLVNGLAVTVGWVLRELLGEPVPDPMVEAFAEVGVKMWPPVPARRPATTSDAK